MTRAAAAVEGRGTVKIAYMTTDEVNEGIAQQLADAHDVTLHTFWPKDAVPNGEYDAVIYDLDHWPCEQRSQFLADLQENHRACRVAVCSSSLKTREVQALGPSRVTYFRRMGPKVFCILCRSRGTTSLQDGTQSN